MSKLKVKIIRETTDPLALRASIGGDWNNGYYLVWRGDDPDNVIEMLREVLRAFEMEVYDGDR